MGVAAGVAVGGGVAGSGVTTGDGVISSEGSGVQAAVGLLVRAADGVLSASTMTQPSPSVFAEVGTVSRSPPQPAKQPVIKTMINITATVFFTEQNLFFS